MTDRIIPLHDGSVGIRLASGSHVAVIDAADLDLVSPYRWRALHGYKGKVYALTTTRAGALYMHRLIAGTGPGYETDHINGNGLDNRRTNLRNATPSQNRANTRKFRAPNGRPSASRFKGVGWDPGRSRWRATITVNNRIHHLGRFDDEKEAARAYDAAAIAAWGPFAVLNFGEGPA